MFQRSDLAIIKKARLSLRIGLLAGLIAGSFLFAGNAFAIVDPLVYQKPANGTLTALEWNNLLLDFVAVRDGGRVGIGTETPGAKLEIYDSSFPRINFNRGGTVRGQIDIGTGFGGAPVQDFVISSPSNNLQFLTGNIIRLTILNNGNVGIGSTTPAQKLTVSGTGSFTQPVIVGVPLNDDHAATKNYVDSTVFTAAGGGIPAPTVTGQTLRASGTSWMVSNNFYNDGTRIGIGTDKPGSLLTLANDGWLSARSGGDVGLVNMFKLNTNNQIEVGAPLLIGPLEFAPDSGLVSLVDMPVTSASPVGSPQGYVMKIDGNNLLSLYSESNGSGGLQNMRLGVNTTTPAYSLDVVGASRFNDPLIVATPVANNHATTKSYVDSIVGGGSGATVGYWTMTGANISNSNAGNVGIGTTTPSEKLDVVGSGNFSGTITSKNASIDGNYYALTNTFATFHHKNLTGAGQYALRQSVNGDTYLNAAANRSVWFNINNATKVIIDTSGNVGIGTTTPASRLSVSGGNVLINDAVITSGTPKAAITKEYLDSSLSAAVSPITLWGGTASGSIWNLNEGNVGIGIENPTAPLHIIKTGGSTSDSNTALILDYESDLTTTIGGGTAIEFRGKSSGGNVANWQQARIRTVGYIGNNSHALAFDVRPSAVYPLTEAVRISSSGSVGIGTTAPDYKLDVTGTGRFTQPVIVGAPTLDGHAATKNYVDSTIGGGSGSTVGYWTMNGTNISNSNTGNVGIGTTNPSSKLHVVAPDGTNIGSYKYNFVLDARDGNVVDGNGLLVKGGADNALGTSFAVQDYSGNTDLMVTGAGNVGIGTTTPAYKLDVSGTGRFTQPVIVGTPTLDGHAATKNYVDSTIGGGSGSTVGYWTMSGANIYNSNTTGNVGIGTTAPSAPLTIQQNSDTAGFRLIGHSDPTTVFSFFIGSGGVNNPRFNSTKSMVFEANGGIYFRGTSAVSINDNNSANVNLVSGGGRVGIGTTAPAYKLDVTGTGRFTQPVIVGTPTIDSHATTKSYVDSTIGGGSGSTVGYWTMDGTNISNSNAGNVGIGISTPSQKLQVYGGSAKFILTDASVTEANKTSLLIGATAANPAAWEIAASDNIGTPSTKTSYLSLRGGNVGIGTNSPGAKLDISGSTANAVLRFTNTASNAEVWDFRPYILGVSNGGFSIYNQTTLKTPLVISASTGNVGVGTTTPAYTLDVSGTGRFTQPVLVGTPTADGHAATKNYVDSTIGGGSGSTVGYWTMSGANIYNSNTTGNVGIGTTNPGVKLDVAGQGRFQSTTFPVVDIIRDTTSAGTLMYGGAKLERLTTKPANNGGIGFYFKYPDSTGASTFAGMFGGALSNITNGSEVGDLVFGAAWRGADPAPNKHLIIRATGATTGNVLVPNGNVGIGTAAPAYTLDVSGTGRFTQPVLVGTPTAAGHATTKSYVDSTAVAAAGGGVGAGTSGQTLRHDGTSWIANSNLYNNGTNVGVGTTAPVQKLDIAGAIKIANTTATCNTDQTGTIKYDSVSGQSYLCDGTRWLNQKNCGIMTDDEGNTYGTVQIGGQCWMAENINIGTMLPSPTSEPTTTDQVIEKWCYNDSAANCETGGGLYNWNEAMRGSTVPGARGICPTGWHIPTDAEYNQLEKTVLGVIDSSNPQYSCGFTTGWQRCADATDPATNNGGTYGVGASLKTVGLGSGVGAGNDLVGFAAKLPGNRNTGGTYSPLGSYLALWSSTESSSTSAWRRNILSTYSTVNRNADNKTHGFSVRCLRD